MPDNVVVSDPLVSAAWLADHADEVVLADVRWYLDGRSGLDAYRSGHLPGARFVDLDRWLADHGDPARGRHPLPRPEVFAVGMRGLGLDDSDTVVAYDDAGGVIAARLVWMLRATGHPAFLLDGGMQAWPGRLDQGDDTGHEPGSFSAVPWPEDRLVDLDDLDHLDGAVLVDARDRPRFRGEQEPVDPRAGHIPGARNLPCRENLREDGTFLPVEELRRRFEALGVRTGQDLVSYCGSGVTACHNLLALEHAGLRPGRLYAGSWSQYSHTDRPAATTGD
jgi:thiosulfate/3-mercaptopyruvate sulfurtransferase